MNMIQQLEKTLPDHVFRQYDIRGNAETEITPSFAHLLGQAFGEKCQTLHLSKVVVGHDNRLSSPGLHEALVRGLRESGCDVIDIGEVTTPMFYYALEHFQLPSGIIVTASHNPGEDNGFKIALDYTTIYGDQIEQLRDAMYHLLENGKSKLTVIGSHEKRSITKAYYDMLKEKIQLGSRKLKVVVDCGNGTTSMFAPHVLRQWGCEVVELYCESDPRFPNHHPDPVEPKNLTDLITKVKEVQADIGISFDGDGDRLGVVDEQGNILWGDQLMILFWREIMPRYPGSEALVEVKCSQALVDEIKKLGGKPVFHRTGHSYIKATMRAKNSPFTGEMSGHLFFRDEYYGFDDALYAAGRLLRILSHTNQPLSSLFTDVPQYYSTPETRIECEEDQKAKVIEQVKRYFASEHDIIDVDGVRILYEEGWGLIRSSNTQPILVLRAEANSQEGLTRIKSEIENALKNAGLQTKIDW